MEVIDVTGTPAKLMTGEELRHDLAQKLMDTRCVITETEVERSDLQSEAKKLLDEGMDKVKADALKLRAKAQLKTQRLTDLREAERRLEKALGLKPGEAVEGDDDTTDEEGG